MSVCAHFCYSGGVAAYNTQITQEPMCEYKLDGVTALICIEDVTCWKV